MSITDANKDERELLDRVRSVLRSQRARTGSSLVAIQPHGSRVPIFGIHPANGEVYFYHKLAPLLGPDQPVYGLRAQGLDGKTAALTRIDDMAAAYRREIVTVQPRGPYVIVGRCAGSRVAYELAQQLTRAGEAVALLCLIDPGPLPGPKSPVQRLDELGRYIRYHAARGNLRRAVIRSATPRLRRVRARLTTVIDVTLRRRASRTTGRATATGLLHHRLISDGHREAPYRGRVLFISAADAVRHLDPSQSWKQLASLDVVQVPGDHRTIASPENLSLLAQHLRRALDDVARGAGGEA